MDTPEMLFDKPSSFFDIYIQVYIYIYNHIGCCQWLSTVRRKRDNMQDSVYIYDPTPGSGPHLLPRSATVFGTLIFAYIVCVGWWKYCERQTAGALLLRYKCLPPPQLPNKWPLGVDWIRKLWHSDSEQHLLAFLCSIADGYEPRNNLFQYLLFGPRAFHVLDPKNLEAVLSIDFRGMSLQCTVSFFSPYPRKLGSRLLL